MHLRHNPVASYQKIHNLSTRSATMVCYIFSTYHIALSYEGCNWRIPLPWPYNHGSNKQGTKGHNTPLSFGSGIWLGFATEICKPIMASFFKQNVLVSPPLSQKTFPHCTHPQKYKNNRKYYYFGTLRLHFILQLSLLVKIIRIWLFIYDSV